MSLFFSSFFRPRLVDALKGYTRQRFYQDVGAGITVGVVALPLAMAFAIASGLKPEAGLFTAIIAGFLISLLGGSRVQIGGPAGAFIVIVYGIVERHGVANLILATAMSGVLLFAMGLLKLGLIFMAVGMSIIMLFNLITLPVEFDASRRAKVLLSRSGMIRPGEEERGVNEVLNAAGLTYVAAFVTSLAYLFYYLLPLLTGREE